MDSWENDTVLDSDYVHCILIQKYVAGNVFE